MKLLLKLIFNGARYAGWQAQSSPGKEDAGVPSVQRTLTDALSECFGFPVRITGCSRTDAGVHALGFCAAAEPADAYDTESGQWLKIPVGRVHRAAAHFLPDDISVCGEALVPHDFHPRYSAVGKTYVYRMTDTVWHDPFESRTAWELPRPVSEEAFSGMRRAASYIPGTRDFSSFMAAGSKILDARRTVKSLEIERNGHGIRMTVSADGFLYHMVRIIAGTLADCAYGSLDPDGIPAVLEARDRSKAGRTAPAHGLFLAGVDYGAPIPWLCE